MERFISLVGGFMSRPKFVGVLLSASVPLLTFACQNQEIWREYQPPSREFKVQFPGIPKETKQTSPLGNNDFKYPKVSWTGDGVALDISFSEIPDLRPLNSDEVKEYYEFLRTQTVKMNNSQLMEANEVSISGKTGHEFTEVRGGGLVVRYRLFLLGTKLLSLRAEQDVGVRPMAETGWTVQKFMESLRFSE